MKFQNDKIDLDVRLTPSEAWRRITETSDLREFTFSARSKLTSCKPFTYRVNGNEINIRKRHNYRNDFSSSLTMKINPTDYGCKLQGRFSVGVVPVVFLICWLAIVGCFSLISMKDIFDRLSNGESLMNFAASDFTLIAMFVGGWAVFIIARFIAKGEEWAISLWLNDLFADSVIKH